MPRSGLSGSESVCLVPKLASFRMVASTRAGEISATIGSTDGFFLDPTSTCCAPAGRDARKAKASAATVAYLIGRLPPEGAGSRFNPTSLAVDSARINGTAI